MDLYYFQAEEIARTAIENSEYTGKRFHAGAGAAVAKAMMFAKERGPRAVLDAAVTEMGRFQLPIINPRWDGSVG